MDNDKYCMQYSICKNPALLVNDKTFSKFMTPGLDFHALRVQVRYIFLHVF